MRLPLFAFSLLPLVAADLAPRAALAGTVLPTGGQVVAGSAQIGATKNSTLTINQSSNRAVISWSGFSIGSGGAVQFNNGSGATLNRVTGAGASSIDGLLSATGSVYLINPNGVVVGKSGVVQVGGGFVASTLDTPNAAFMAGGDLTFSGASSASVLNLGKVGALGGDVALIAASVENDGSITAANGTVGLIAGQSVLMRDQALDGGKFQVLVGGTGTSATNTGAIQAAQAELRAEGGNVYALAGNTGGVIRATGVSASDGKVFLVAGDGDVTVDGAVSARAVNGAGGAINVSGGLVANNGSLDASGLAGGSVAIVAQSLLNSGAVNVSGQLGAGGAVTANVSRAYVETAGGSIQASGATGGGTIQVQAGQSLFTSGAWSANGGSGAGGVITALANAVNLADASFTATGAQGGAIRVGGDFHGAADLTQAATTTVTAGSILDASATSGAGGGSAVVWSSSQTAFFGTASALGAGNIEISSGGGLIMGGLANAGVGGHVLFDPKNIIIDATAGAYPQYQLVDPDPSASDGFGSNVTKLPNGNIVVTAPGDSLAASGSGAVYLFNSKTGALISALTGSQANDNVGSGGVAVLTNGNFVVSSPDWANGTAFDAGAATWASGGSGISGAVSTSNSLTGSRTGDLVSLYGVIPLSGGAYVVLSPFWANGAASSAGAVTWASGATGLSGLVTTANSLVGSQTGDQVGINGVTVLTDGDFVVQSPYWAKGTAAAAGAVTWSNGAVVGAVSASNSLTGSKASDEVGVGGVTVLGNGDYVVASPYWNGAAGAATWGNGAGGTVGVVSATNSIVGSLSASSDGTLTGDQVGSAGIFALTNGNYVIASPSWGKGLGAATWGNGAGGTVGTISAANSLVGSQAGDAIGSGGIIALTNGNYVVDSPTWANGSASTAGAVTWGSGVAGVMGAVSTSNSLTGSHLGDFVGSAGVIALTNGDYVVASPQWANGSIAGAGAATWANGTTGITGLISSANSLVGTQANDAVASDGVAALPNGDYVIDSPQWANGTASGAGAVTWANGATGITGLINSSNSLVGAQANDAVGYGGVAVLTNGNYVVDSPFWASGSLSQAGAATWANGATGVTGAISSANSLVGSHAGDLIGIDGVVALANGNYVVVSENWKNGSAANAGAVTWASGTAGVVGAVSVNNSLVGSHTNDLVGNGGVDGLADGDYIVTSLNWANGSTGGVGAITLANGTIGARGALTAANSLVSSQAGQSLQWVMNPDDTNTFVVTSLVTNPTTGSMTSQVLVGVTDLNALIFGMAQGQTVTITPQAIIAELATGSDVTLQADNDITVNSAVTVSGAATGAELTLEAGRSILINASITTNNAPLTLLANAPLADGVINSQRDAGAAVITMASGATINAGTGAVSITMANGAGKTNATAGAISISSISGGSVDVENDGANAGSDVILAGGTLTASAGLTLSAAGNLKLAAGATTSVAGATHVDIETNLSGNGGALIPLAAASGLTGSLQFTGAEGGGQSLTINGQGYTLLYTANELQNISLTSGFYALVRSINLSGVTWTPIGTNSSGTVLNGGNGFAATLNGLGNAISNLTINKPSVSDVGLFGYVGASGAVADVTLTNASITANTSVGAIAGYNKGTLTGDTASGAVAGASNAGGIVGYNAGTIVNTVALDSVTGSGSSSQGLGGLVGWNAGGGTILASTASGTVKAAILAGGLVGVNSGVISAGSAASGSVTGTSDLGGLVGYNAGTLSGVSASGAVSGAVEVGGLVGLNIASGLVSGSSSSGGTVSGTADVGGLVGHNAGYIVGSPTADVVVGVGASYGLGGLVGWNDASGTIDSSGASGTVSGVSLLGGLVGVNSGLLRNSDVAWGSVTGTSDVGGLVGYNAGTLGSVSARGSVTGVVEVGGLVGLNIASGLVIGSSSTGGMVSGTADVGGLVGHNAGYIVGSPTADVVVGVGASYGLGGLVGWNDASGTLDSSGASGAVSGVSLLGGLVGVNSGLLRNSDVAWGSVTGTSDVGGLVGYNTGSLAGVSANGPVSGVSDVGGLVGVNLGVVNNAFAAGAVFARSADAGGLIGYNAPGAGVANVYSLGNVSGGANVGGLFGINYGYAAVGYATGAVSGGSTTGGVIGFNGAGANVGYLYWDLGTTRQSIAIGGNGGSATSLIGVGGSSGLSAYSAGTYAGFDFTNIWGINPGASRPYLKTLAASTPRT